jgi:hypothetical protein
MQPTAAATTRAARATTAGTASSTNTVSLI